MQRAGEIVQGLREHAAAKDRSAQVGRLRTVYHSSAGDLMSLASASTRTHVHTPSPTDAHTHILK